MNKSTLIKIGIGIAIFLFLNFLATIASNFSLEHCNIYEGYLKYINPETNVISVALDTSVNVYPDSPFYIVSDKFHGFGVEDSEAISKIKNALENGYPFVKIWYDEGIANGPRQIGYHSYQLVYKIEMDGEVILYDPGTWKDFICISVTLAILIALIKVIFSSDENDKKKW
ncbi:MAG: hypothetical protein MJ211_15600 [Bacteroidales bacterium]|nr:hypothetical protein [Bacteroidales bacterium]